MKSVLIGTALITLSLAQSAMQAMPEMMNYVESPHQSICFTAQGVNPQYCLDYHTHTPLSGPINGVTMSLHIDLMVNNFNISGWASNSSNTIFSGFSFINGTQSDGVMCSLKVTGNNMTDSLNCYDGYLKSISDPTVILADP